MAESQARVVNALSARKPLGRRFSQLLSGSKTAIRKPPGWLAPHGLTRAPPRDLSVECRGRHPRRPGLHHVLRGRHRGSGHQPAGALGGDRRSAIQLCHPLHLHGKLQHVCPRGRVRRRSARIGTLLGVRRSRTAFRDRPETVRLHPGTVRFGPRLEHLDPGEHESTARRQIRRHRVGGL